ncbi:MAG: alpha-L-fucosidase, partial [Bacteroidetes bacterium]|nr:alpha-L-fucosidase [Bacteroidota bacterium]
MNKIGIILIALALVIQGRAQNNDATIPTKRLFSESAAAKAQRMAWWTNDRFGMFIHWGIYSMAARHEWVKHNEHMTNEEYQKYFDFFNPD